MTVIEVVTDNIYEYSFCVQGPVLRILIFWVHHKKSLEIYSIIPLYRQGNEPQLQTFLKPIFQVSVRDLGSCPVLDSEDIDMNQAQSLPSKSLQTRKKEENKNLWFGLITTISELLLAFPILNEGRQWPTLSNIQTVLYKYCQYLVFVVFILITYNPSLVTRRHQQISVEGYYRIYLTGSTLTY